MNLCQTCRQRIESKPTAFKTEYSVWSPLRSRVSPAPRLAAAEEVLQVAPELHGPAEGDLARGGEMLASRRRRQDFVGM